MKYEDAGVNISKADAFVEKINLWHRER